MEIRENLSNDAITLVNVKPDPVVVNMKIADREGGVTSPANSDILLNNSNNNCISTPTKKAIEREMRQPFPVKVYEMLENAEKQKFDHIVSWNEAGTGFMVHDKDHFTKEIVPHYFNLTKYKSFQRQLSLYGFQRVTVGPNKGLRYHEKLRKGELELVRQMKPVGYKPRNLTRLLGPKKHKQQQQQQLKRATNIMTTTTTTVVKTTTTSTTLLANESTPSAIPIASTGIIDAAAPRNVTMSTILCKSPILDASASSIPSVVSSSSLIKQEDHEAITIESEKQLEQQNNQVHSISPETTYRNPIHLQSRAGSDFVDGHACNGVSNNRQHRLEDRRTNHVGPQAEPEIVTFEGMCFYLMSPTRELGINVKLKLLEEFNPASSLLRLASKYVTPGYITKPQTDDVAASVPESIPITIDTVQDDRPSLLEPFTDIFSTAAATSTASTIAALQTALANSTAINNEPIPTTTNTPFLSSSISNITLESQYMDPSDYPLINVTNRI